MIKAILFDLDDTLLGNNTDTFVLNYFDRLGKYAAPLLPPDQFITLLLACTRETIQNTDPTLTNHDVFWRAFTRETGLDAIETEAFFAEFYWTEFSQLRDLTQPRPCAAHLIRYCLNAGLAVVIATNPLFPRAAIEQRLEWAGVPVSQFDYALVTTIENMHATKPNRAYYEEILARIGCAPEETIMVGDNWKNDMEPAAGLGIALFWISDDVLMAPDSSILKGAGSLDEFYAEVQNGWLET